MIHIKYVLFSFSKRMNFEKCRLLQIICTTLGFELAFNFQGAFLRSITVLFILFKTSPEIFKEKETDIIKTSSADDIFS